MSLKEKSNAITALVSIKESAEKMRLIISASMLQDQQKESKIWRKTR